MNQTCPASADDSFGPLVVECLRTFDFTLLFENTILSIAPSAILLLLAPIRLISLYPRERKVTGQKLQKIKLGTIILFGILQVILLVLWGVNDNRTPSAIASTALAAINVILFCLLSWTEHAKSIRPSVLLNIYFLFSLIFDIARTRTLFLANVDTKICAFFTLAVILKLVILVLEAWEKRRYIRTDGKNLSPEETYGILNQSFFVWLNPLLVNGFKRAILINDLFPLPDALETTHLQTLFEKAWQSSPVGGKHRLLGVILKSLRWELLAPVPGRIGIIAFTFCQPLLLERFINYLQEAESPRTGSYGVGLILAYGVVYLGLAVSNGFYWHQVYRSITMIRGIAVSAIYHKTMLINVAALDNSQAVTLMSTDVQRIVDGLKLVHEIWANVFQIAIATYLLALQIGVGCVAPLSVAIACLFVIAFIGNIAGPRQAIWMKVLEKRVGVTATMLSSMKGVKMTGLTSKMSALIQQLRVDEIRSGTKFRMVLVYAISLAFAPQLLAPVFAFAIFSVQAFRDGITLDSTRIFTATSLMVLLATPLTQTIQNIPELMGAVSCIGRIQKFLESEPRVDERKTIPTSHVSIPYPTLNMISELDDGTEVEVFRPLSTISVKKPVIEAEDVTDAVLIQEGVFGWKEKEEAILKDINLAIPPAQLTFIIGPVACGKSTLLKAILGETLFSEGLVQITSESVAFCDQTPWLINDTIQKNIIGYSMFEPAWYRTVTQACVLDSDIATFPLGDQTMVGSNGITLSGGQKQRLTIARAIYSRKRIAIFDDVFSGLDATTQHLLFRRVFAAGGLLPQQEITVIIATHAVNLLPAADYIVALGSDGQIAQQGSFDELNIQHGYVSSLDLKKLVESDSDSMDSLETTETFVKPAAIPVSSAVDDAKRQGGDLSLYTYYFRTMGVFSMLVFFAGEATFAFFSTFPTIWLEWWSNNNAVTPNARYSYYLGGYAGLQLSGIVVITLLAYHICQRMIVQSGTKLHEVILKTVMNAPMAFFSQTDIGITTNRFSQDIQLIDSELPISLLDFVAGIFVVISQAVLIANASYYIAIAYPALIAVFFIVQKLYLRTSRQLRLMDLEMKSPLYSLFLESLSGLPTVRAFGWQEESITLNGTLLDISQRPFYLLFMIQRWLTLVLDLIAVALAVIVVTVAVSLRTTTSPGFTGVALVNIISFTDFLKHLIVVWTNLETALGAVSRIKEFSLTTETENLPGEIREPPFNWPRKGGIDIRNLSASYDGSSTNKALDNISLSIKDGEKVAICGHSGSGKSSLVLALFRMMEIQAGSIHIEDIDIATLPREDVRSRLNAIPQDPYFLSGSVRTNIDPYESSSDPRMVVALTKVGLWAKFEQAGGLDAEFDVDSLSHGQRQLFCLARAILRGGKILVLDEATSSVDRETDRLMQRIIRQEFRNCTIIAIVHRLETVRDFDRIVVLDKGVLVECDRPDVLLARDSAYKRMYEMYESNRQKEEDSIGLDSVQYPSEKYGAKSGMEDQYSVQKQVRIEGVEERIELGHPDDIPMRHLTTREIKERNRRSRSNWSVASIKTAKTNGTDHNDVLQMQFNGNITQAGNFLGGASSVSDITLAMMGVLQAARRGDLD